MIAPAAVIRKDALRMAEPVNKQAKSLYEYTDYNIYEKFNF